MYLDRFQLREDPFGATADPRYFFRSDTHARALSQAVSATCARSPLQTLISPPGLGKTSLLLTLFEELSTLQWTYRWTPMSTALELYRSVLADLGTGRASSDLATLRSEFLTAVRALEERHGAFILVLDEAQNLTDSVLHEVSGMIEQSPGSPQLILSGQPKLSAILSSAAHASLRKHLKDEHVLAPLVPSEVSAYLDHRLRVAGHTRGGLFSRAAIALIASASAGVPRVINNICWTAMSRAASVAELGEVDVRRALEVLRLEPPSERGIALKSKEFHVTAPAPASANRIDPVLFSSALQTWLRKKVRWSGTAGELLSELSAQTRVAPEAYGPSPADVVESLKSQRAALSSHGIEVDFVTRQGLPQLIMLRMTAAPNSSAESAPPAELTASVQPAERPTPQAETTSPLQHESPKTETTILKQAQGQQHSNPRRNRWRAIHIWAFTSLLAMAGAMFTVYKRSQSSYVRAAETRELSDLGDQELETERRLAETGDPTAQRALALRYLNGNGVPKDRAMRLLWLRKAAMNRDIESQYLLGLDLAVDSKPEAYKWLVISHLAGNAKSFAELQRLTPELTPDEIGKVRYALGLAYANGEGTEIDYVRAYTWMTLATAAGVSESKQKIAEFAQKMSREQIASASRQSSAWLARMRASQVQDQPAHD